MKALCVRQPFAELIARGIKRLDIHSWDTSYRGPLAIVAPDSWHRYADEVMEEYGLVEADCPRSITVCIVELHDTERRPQRISRAAARRIDEAACVNVAPGEFMFMMQGPRRVAPVKVRRLLRIYSIPDESIRVLPVRP
jgi:hypothetical protein